MTEPFSYKGIPPGIVLSRTLKKRGITQESFADKVGTHRQTINAIVTGKRDIPEGLSFKLDKALGFDEGFFLLVQTYYKIEMNKRKNTGIIGTVPKIRPVVFWDIDMEKLDWIKNKDFIIQRVNEKGNEEEIKQVNRFYAP